MKKDTIALTAVVVSGALILAALFGRVIVHPDSYLFSSAGDAVKSYYNFSYYLKYDSGMEHNGIAVFPHRPRIGAKIIDL